jgi:hypothetical protein
MVQAVDVVQTSLRGSIMFTVLEERDLSGWVTGVYNNAHWFQAKVYKEPSRFGIAAGTNGKQGFGNVSKLAILKTPTVNQNTDFLSQCCFNYDRGLDFNKAPAGVVDAIVTWCEETYGVR